MAQTRRSLGAAALVEKLIEIGWSRRRLEKELKLPAGAVYKWAAGKIAPDISNALLLERVIGLPVEVWDLRREESR